MSKVYVVFKDASETEIATAFSAEQDPLAWPDLVEIDSDDLRFIAFISGVGSPPEAWPGDEA